MRVCCISDLHGYLPDLKDYPADLLLIAGDISPVYNHDINFQIQWFNTDFNNWCRYQRSIFDKIIFVAGNHDLCFPHDSLSIKNDYAQYVQDEIIEYNSFKIYGSPWQLPFGRGWAFNADEKSLKLKFKKVNNVDIIVSHGPCFGYGDLVPRYINNDFIGYENTGSIELLALVDRVKPKLVVTAHIHESYGRYERDGAKIVNASLLNDLYEIVNNPIIVDL